MLPTRGPDHWETLSRAALSGSATVWLIVTLAGQVVFAAYVANFYGGAAIAGEYERWSKVLPRGIDSTDPLGNAILGLHLLLAVAWVLSGMLQLIPAGRRHLPALHRWNGRLYIGFAAVSLATSRSTWPSASTRYSFWAAQPWRGAPRDCAFIVTIDAGRSACSWWPAASGSSASA